MGYKFEVHAWVKPDRGGHTFETVYGGGSLLRALAEARKARRQGAGMVKIEWR